jgi:hypothetical protein
MLFSRLVSAVALLSLAGSVLAAPLPTPGSAEITPDSVEIKPVKDTEVEVEKEDGKYEVELETPVSEVEIEIKDPAPQHKARSPVKRSDRSLAASVLQSQQELDTLKPQIG